MNSSKLIIFAAVMLIFSPAIAGELWTEDFAAAKKTAAKEDKDLLLNFSGSDWCGWCQKLDKEVFDHESFTPKATKEYVPVKLDFPRNAPQSDEIKKQNRALQRTYGVSGFPTILLTDADGEVYARTGYQKGGPEKYLTHLAELQKNKEQRNALEKKIENADGVKKAKAMDALVEWKQDEDLPVDPAVYGKIVELAPEDTDGLKTKYQSKALMHRTMKNVEASMKNKNAAGAVKSIDEGVKSETLGKEERQKLLFVKGQIHLSQGDATNGLKAFQDARAVDPATRLGTGLANLIERLKKQMAQQQKQPKK